MLIKPPLWFIGYVIGLAAFGAGWTINGWRYKSREAKAIEQAYKQRDEANARANGLAADYETVRLALDENNTETEIKIRTVYRDRKVIPDCAIPPGAASLLNDTRSAANAAITGKPSGTVQDHPTDSPE